MTCSVDGCEQDSKARGWCVMHYNRWRRSGDVGEAAPQKTGPKTKPREACSVEGCDRITKSGRLCPLHTSRLRAHGEVGSVEPLRRSRTAAPCSIEDCEKPSFCRTWCSAHYVRWQRHGDPTAQIRQSPLAPDAKAKTCPRCEEIKSLEEFGARTARGGGLKGYCRDCQRDYDRQYMQTPEGRESRRVAALKYSRANRGQRLKRYGITVADYDAMFEAQGGVCAICSANSPGGGGEFFAVDHCHQSTRVRGLLCTSCNLGIGQLGDDPARLRAAAAYIENARNLGD